ncbi:MAG: adenine phosphoribosyltransferase [Acetilactobacillus jinshanensis]
MAFDFTKYISSYKDFPKKGILFRDISPLIEDPTAFRAAINRIAEFAKKERADVIVAPEARGFIVGSPVAYKLGIGFVPARKKGKLPTDTVSASYGLEYGKSTLYLEKGAVKPGERVVIVDDLLATGGTYAATAKLVQQLKGKVVGAGFIIELAALKGRKKVHNADVLSLVKY